MKKFVKALALVWGLILCNGAAYIWGHSLLDTMLVGLAMINGMKLWIIIVVAVILAMMTVLCVTLVKREARESKLRKPVYGVITVVWLSWATLFSTLYADNWLNSYRVWCGARQDFLHTMDVVGAAIFTIALSFALGICVIIMAIRHNYPTFWKKIVSDIRDSGASGS